MFINEVLALSPRLSRISRIPASGSGWFLTRITSSFFNKSVLNSAALASRPFSGRVKIRSGFSIISSRAEATNFVRFKSASYICKSYSLECTVLHNQNSSSEPLQYLNCRKSAGSPHEKRRFHLRSSSSPPLVFLSEFDAFVIVRFYEMHLLCNI